MTMIVGREQLLHDLRETLDARHVAVLAGARGSGKTALARAYVHRFQQDYEQVLWLDMATPETLLLALLTQGQLGFWPEGASPVGLAGLREVLDRWISYPGHLLVIDQVCFPAGALLTGERRTVGGHVVLIGQDEALQPLTRRLLVVPLKASEGTLLLTPESRTSISQQSLRLFQELAREMGGSPLALTLARSYLDATGCGPQAYLLAYRDCPERPTSSSTQDLVSLEIACDLWLAHLAAAHPLALRLLQACVLLSCCPIPRALMLQERLRVLLMAEETEPSATDVRAALQRLVDAKLLEEQAATATLRIHPQLAEVVRLTLPLEHRHRLYARLMLACLQLAASCEQEDERERDALRIALAGHIRALATEMPNEEDLDQGTADACAWAAFVFSERGLLREGETLLRQALQIWERLAGQAHPLVAQALLTLAQWKRRLGDDAIAEADAHRAIAVTVEVLGIAHCQVLAGLNVLADIYVDQGKFHEVAVCSQHALSIGERVGLQTHPLYEVAQHTLLQVRHAETAAKSPSRMENDSDATDRSLSCGRCA